MGSAANNLAEEFKSLWQRGCGPSVEEFIELRQPLSLSMLTELLLLDQSMNWEIGTTINAEGYFQRFPNLLEHRDAAMDLVFSEFLLMERVGMAPNIEHFVVRFPQFADDLRRQAAFHRAVGTDVLLGDETFVNSASIKTESQASTAKLPDVAGYEILAELGRGGIGVVYKARHKKLNRLVALKMLLAGNFASPVLLRRFLTEAEATARLQHPGIVQIYEVGQSEGRPFLALEFVNGGTLAQWAGGRPQLPHIAAKLTRLLASAVQFAHQQGVVHRDLKPANILIQNLTQSPIPESTTADPLSQRSTTPFFRKTRETKKAHGTSASNEAAIRSRTDSTSPQGLQLKIADFGLAKVLEPDTDRVAATMSGEVIGTASYMSPEQARGDATKLGASTDVYALGAILYELLTGRPPFVGVQPIEVLRQVIADEPVRPSQLVQRVPQDIQTICLKCLEKSAVRRYESAGALVDDLDRFLGGEPIAARHTSKIERGWRWCRHHPIGTVITTSIAAIILLVAIISSVYSIRLGQQLTLTSEAKNQEQFSRIQAVYQLWESKLAQADAIRNSNRFGRRHDALDAVDAARKLGDSIDFTSEQIDRMRNATIAALALPDYRIVRQWKDNFFQVPFATRVTTDRRMCLYAYVGNDQAIHVRRTTDESPDNRIEVADSNSIPLLSGDGKYLAILNDHCRVYRLDEDPPKLFYESASGGSWGFTPDGTRMLGTRGDGQLHLVDLANNSVIQSFGTIAAIDDVAISPDGRRAAVYDGNSVRVINLESKQIQLKIDKPELRGEKHFAWHPNANLLAVGPFATEEIELWDVESGVRMNKYFHDTGELLLCFDSTGERLLTFDAWGLNLMIWDIGNQQAEIPKTRIALSAVTPSETGGFNLLECVSGSLIASVIEHPRTYYTLPLIRPSGTPPLTNDFDYSDDGRLLAAVSRGILQIFDSRTFAELDRIVVGHCYVKFDRDGSMLTSNQAGLARWPLSIEPKTTGTTNDPPARHIRLGPPVYLSQAVAYSQFDVSQDGEVIAVARGNEVEIESPNHPEWPQIIGPHNDIRHVSISPDSRRVVTGGWLGGNACVWDLSTGKLLHTFEEPNCCVVQFSPNGKLIVTTTYEVRIWHAETYDFVAKLPVVGGSESGMSVCFSNDSKWIAVSDSLSQIHLFNPVDGKKLLTLLDPNGRGSVSMVFSPDDSQLAVMSNAENGSRVVHVWDLRALHHGLEQRGLSWSSAETSLTTPDDSTPLAAAVTKNYEIVDLKLIGDQKLAEIDATLQLDLLNRAMLDFDLTTAQATIARLNELQPREPLTCNNFAWALATGPEPIRNPEMAVEFARHANEAESLSQEDRALFINTLGIALYRANQIAEAEKILRESLAMQPDQSQPFDLYFLSMCSSRRGDQENAQNCFNRAEKLVEQFQASMTGEWRKELTGFSNEARQFLAEADSVK